MSAASVRYAFPSCCRRRAQTDTLTDTTAYHPPFQITALLLALAPLWSLTIALYQWPERQRRLERRKRREEYGAYSHTAPPAGSSSTPDQIHAPGAEPDGHSGEGKDKNHIAGVVVPARDLAAPVSAAAAKGPTAPRPSGVSARAHSNMRPRRQARPSTCGD